uniref:Uncharacterized protein n=1 Tax=Arundo donax TaxID=35708 RepID=A0A0A8YNT8_ARUDO
MSAVCTPTWLFLTFLQLVIFFVQEIYRSIKYLKF